jgi:hypothetical protein
MNVVVAGSRDFNDYPMLKRFMDYITRDLSDIKIVSGKARGADTLGEFYAKEKGYEVLEHPAQWDKFGKIAGYIRNEDMCLVSDIIVCFWDGVSKGTRNMINLGKRHNKKTYVINYVKKETTIYDKNN